MKENGSFDPVFEIGDRYLLVKLPAHPYYLGVQLYQKGLIVLEQGKRDEAANLFKKSAEITLHFPEVWAAIGRLEGLYGDIEKARRAFQRTIEENPQFEKAYLEWGKIEDQAGNLGGELKLFLTVLTFGM